MRIDFVEMRNFRRLAAIRIDFSPKTTLLVGSNNSGKTSALSALRYFLIQKSAFTAHDIPLARWADIDAIGVDFEKEEREPYAGKWRDSLPSLDVWLNVSSKEIHHVRHLIPTLDWKPGEGVGVRLQLEPKASGDLLAAYHAARTDASTTMSQCRSDDTSDPTATASADGPSRKFSLWPDSLMDFLKRRMRSHLCVRAYLLDPAKKVPPDEGVAQPQQLPETAEPLEDDPFKGLLKISEVPAHRVVLRNQ